MENGMKPKFELGQSVIFRAKTRVVGAVLMARHPVGGLDFFYMLGKDLPTHVVEHNFWVPEKDIIEATEENVAEIKAARAVLDKYGEIPR